MNAKNTKLSLSLLVILILKVILNDYGGLGKTTCIWIDHGLDELPQLIILHEVLIEYESCKVRDCLSEFKDKYARLRSVTNALLLLHSLRNHVVSCIYLSLLSHVRLRSLVHSLVLE